MNWFEPTLRDFLESEGNLAQQSPSTVITFSTYSNFEQSLLKTFGEPDEARTKANELKNLRQRGAATQYAAKFKQIAAYLKWDNEPLMEAFYDGLKDSVKDDLYKDDMPDSLDDYIEMAVKIDNRHY